MKPRKYNYPKSSIQLLDFKYLALCIYKGKIYHFEPQNRH